MLAHVSCMSRLLCVGERLYTIRVMSSTGASEALGFHIPSGPQSSGTHSHHYYLFQATRYNCLNAFV
jgi:hypothetical protein